jgi:hypothetical protein
VKVGMINDIYETGEWTKDFTEVTVTKSKKKPGVTKGSIHLTISLIAHTAKIVASILRRRTERNVEDFIEEEHFGFRRGNGTRDKIGMLKIISE